MIIFFIFLLWGFFFPFMKGWRSRCGIRVHGIWRTQSSSGDDSSGSYGILLTIRHLMLLFVHVHSHSDPTDRSMIQSERFLSSGQRRQSIWSLCWSLTATRACSSAAFIYSTRWHKNVGSGTPHRPITGRSFLLLVVSGSPSSLRSDEGPTVAELRDYGFTTTT